MRDAVASDFVGALEARGVLTTLREPMVFKMMTHLEIDDADIEDALTILDEVTEELASVGPGTDGVR